MEPVNVFQKMIEKFREPVNVLSGSCWFRKFYDNTRTNVILHILENKYVHKRYIDAIKDTYFGVITCVSTIGWEIIIFQLQCVYIKVFF